MAALCTTAMTNPLLLHRIAAQEAETFAWTMSFIVTATRRRGCSGHLLPNRRQLGSRLEQQGVVETCRIFRAAYRQLPLPSKRADGFPGTVFLSYPRRRHDFQQHWLSNQPSVFSFDGGLFNHAPAFALGEFVDVETRRSFFVAPRVPCRRNNFGSCVEYHNKAPASQNDFRRPSQTQTMQF